MPSLTRCSGCQWGVWLRTVCLAAFGVAALGCATPAPLVRLSPLDPNVLWVSGRAAVVKEQGGVRVAAAFEHEDGNTLAVRVEVRNDTEQRLEVDPQRITFMTCTDSRGAVCVTPRRVVDPELALTALAKQRSLEEAEAANDAAIMVPILLLSAVGDVATIASGKASPTTGLGTSWIADGMNANTARHETATTSLAAQHEVWANVALRRNTLLPHTACAGLVYVPTDLDARSLWIGVRIAEGAAFPFPFAQTVTQVLPANAEASFAENSQQARSGRSYSQTTFMAPPPTEPSRENH